MPTFIQNSDGSQSEVFTKEEVESQVKAAKEEVEKGAESVATKAAQEAIEQFKKDNPDRGEEIDQLKKDLTEATDALQKAEEANEGEDDPDKKKGREEQIKRLKDAATDAEKALKEGMEGVEKQISDLKESITRDHKEELLNKLAGDDKDLREKIELHFDSFQGDALTKSEIAQRMENAALLATGKKPEPGVLDGITGAGDKGDGSAEEKKGQPTENEKAIGKTLGITEKDREEFGPGGSKDHAGKSQEGQQTT